MTDEELIEMARPQIAATLKDRPGRSVAVVVRDVPGGPEVRATRTRDLDPSVQRGILRVKMRNDQRAVIVFQPTSGRWRLVVATLESAS